AIRQHRTIRIARAQIAAAQGRIDSAHVPLHPTLSVSGGGTVGGPRLMNDFLTERNGLQANATASWTITDFGLTRANIHAAEANEAASAAGAASTGLDIRQSVELAYLEAIARQRLVIV